jgi:CRP-like cAMP-binding protein
MSSSKEFGHLFENLVLAALPRSEYERLRPHLETVKLMQGKVLYNVGDTIQHVYFLKGGMASLLSLTEDGLSVEVGMVGNEGVVGTPVVLRMGTMPYQVVVQLSANAVRLRSDVLQAEFNRGGRLQDLMLRYMHTLLTQISQSAACNRFHSVEERLCRWLLISRDRIQTEIIPLTQEFLSQMMGSPRTSVTAIAGNLQRAGIISYNRGKVQILNRQELEAVSCECYRIVREEIRHYLAA